MTHNPALLLKRWETPCEYSKPISNKNIVSIVLRSLSRAEAFYFNTNVKGSRNRVNRRLSDLERIYNLSSQSELYEIFRERGIDAYSFNQMLASPDIDNVKTLESPSEWIQVFAVIYSQISLLNPIEAFNLNSSFNNSHSRELANSISQAILRQISVRGLECCEHPELIIADLTIQIIAKFKHRFKPLMLRLPNLEITSFQNFFSKYPFFSKLLSELIITRTSNVNTMLSRFADDKSKIAIFLSMQTQDLLIADLKIEAGDAHNDGQSVILLTLPFSKKIVYKPKDVSTVAWVRSAEQLLFKHLDKSYHFGTAQILNCGKYGWEEFIESNLIQDRKSVV